MYMSYVPEEVPRVRLCRILENVRAILIASLLLSASDHTTILVPIDCYTKAAQAVT